MSFELSRRHFLAQASVFLAAVASPPSVFAASDLVDVLLGGCRYKDIDKNVVKCSLVRVVPAQGDVQHASVDFFPHGLAFIGSIRKCVFAFEKIGPGAGLVDLEKMQLVESIPPVKGRLFYGHGACSMDGQLLYSTETAITGMGAIGVREINSLQYLGDFPTYGSHPHDCHLIENGDVLVVTNGGGDQASGQLASICYIDVQSQKLLERIEMTDERFNAGHLFPLAGRQSILLSAPRRNLNEEHLGAVSIQRNNQALDVLSQPPDVVNNMFGEALSVLALPGADFFVATHPTPGMVTIWQLSSGKLLKRFDLPRTRGLALSRDQKGIWISHGVGAGLVQMKLADFSLGSHMPATYITGSHLFSL
ncbi:DUF1513 domain-containing protein [Chitinimonas sp. BJB300]|uniref:DUF1513 domain-containing protein n=1 Tax=Chitinimonas sp. BJB300 TaxID=1559339 RepID=UPI000C1096F1|nr:DUF1513 domain-containing protein [Chitinimonas sp. BJB300]PHV12965.1 hypothetical protein CSQ89_03040 [Chitinimonas sp. BJB300]TSJ89082.1 DUF1513 domain-containing protein [Chitinimonas sp. BJB300]